MHYADRISVLLIFSKILVPFRKRMARHFILSLIIFLLFFHFIYFPRLVGKYRPRWGWQMNLRLLCKC